MKNTLYNYSIKLEIIYNFITSWSPETQIIIPILSPLEFFYTSSLPNFLSVLLATHIRLYLSPIKRFSNFLYPSSIRTFVRVPTTHQVRPVTKTGVVRCDSVRGLSESTGTRRRNIDKA